MLQRSMLDDRNVCIIRDMSPAIIIGLVDSSLFRRWPSRRTNFPFLESSKHHISSHGEDVQTQHICRYYNTLRCLEYIIFGHWASNPPSHYWYLATRTALAKRICNHTILLFLLGAHKKHKQKFRFDTDGVQTFTCLTTYLHSFLWPLYYI